MSDRRAFVFDLDDTLYPEWQFVESGFQAVASWAEMHLGVSDRGIVRELCALTRQHGSGKTFDRWLAARGLDADHVPSMIAAYRQHVPRINPFPEVPALLARLKQAGRLALISDGYLDVQQRKLAALGLATFFDVVVFSDRWGREFWKPHPRSFETVLSELRLVGPDVVYVADNPGKDFAGARRTGMATVRVRFGGLYSDALPATVEHAADEEVDNFTDLERVLLSPRPTSGNRSTGD